MTDHQLARSTAEKIRPWTSLNEGEPGISVHEMQERYNENEDNITEQERITEIILASYHERDLAATAVGGETPRSDALHESMKHLCCTIGEEDGYGYRKALDFARTLERELNEARSIYLNKADQLASENARAELAESELKAALRGQKTLCDNLESITADLTALQESNREVVADNARLEVESVRQRGYHVGTITELGYAQSELLKLRARLALADEMAEALEGFLGTGDIEKEIADARSALSRWTAPQAGTTLGGDDNARPAVQDTRRDVTPAIPSEPASRAVPITPEQMRAPQTLPAPAWYFIPDVGWGPPEWVRRIKPFDRGAVLVCTHYHPDQPTPPTSRPTATEGGKV